MPGYYYYFISSPLHFLFAVNMAIQHRDMRNVAVLTSRLEGNVKLMSEVIRRDGQVFCDVLTFEGRPGRSKHQERKRRMQVLRDYLAERPAAKLFTGTDRHVEFQYAMHLARRRDPTVEGIYLDEGTHTYLGARRMHRLQHKYGDLLLKWLYYGTWWKSPVIIGSSAWISTVHAVFPDLVHPMYREKGKTILPVDRQSFSDPAFERITRILMDVTGIDRAAVADVDYVLILTHDTHYEDAWAHIERIMTTLSAHCAPERIAIKAHPRSKLLAQLRQKYPGSVHLDNRVGFELMLPLFNERCVFIGDVTTVLFTIKWFMPDRRVLAIEVAQPSIEHYLEPMQQLFRSVNIRQLSYPEFETELREIAGGG